MPLFPLLFRAIRRGKIEPRLPPPKISRPICNNCGDPCNYRKGKINAPLLPIRTDGFTRKKVQMVCGALKVRVRDLEIGDKLWLLQVRTSWQAGSHHHRTQISPRAGLILGSKSTFPLFIGCVCTLVDLFQSVLQ